MADRHSATLLSASAVVVAVGGIFMAVTALEPSKVLSSVWTNAWFNTGFAVVILGLLLGASGIYLHFRRENSAGREVGEIRQPAATHEQTKEPEHELASAEAALVETNLRASPREPSSPRPVTRILLRGGPSNGQVVEHSSHPEDYVIARNDQRHVWRLDLQTWRRAANEDLPVYEYLGLAEPSPLLSQEASSARMNSTNRRREKAISGEAAVSTSDKRSFQEGGKLSLPAIHRIVSVMTSIDELAETAGLQNLVLLLPTDIRSAVRYAPQPRAQLIHLIRTCESFPDGRLALTEALSLIVGNPAQLGHLLRVLEEEWPT